MKLFDAKSLLTHYACCVKPLHVENRTLSSLAEISAGYPFRGAVDALPSGLTPVVQMKDVDLHSGIAWQEVSWIELPSMRSASPLRAGDILFGARGTRNPAILVNDPPEGSVCSPHFFVIRLRPSEFALPEYIAWLINQRPAQEHFRKGATGSYILNIRREVLESLPVPVPSVEWQQAVVRLAQESAAERLILNQLIVNREQQMEAIAVHLHHHRES